MTKLCKRCGVEKPTSAFYGDKRAKDGLYTYCGFCHTTLYTHKRKPVCLSEESNQHRLERVRAYASEYMKNPEQRAKRQGRERLRYAVRMGKILKKPCEVCGELRVQAHHYKGYGKLHALDVQWLCIPHHHAQHPHLTRKLKP